MFGFLKKKLKEGIEKITKTISEKEEEKIKEVVEEVKKEEHLKETKEELVKEVEKEIEKPEEIKEVEEKPFEGVKITYFIHGSTVDNEKELASGWADAELSDLGKKQSIELKDLIKEKKFDFVFCSDFARAVDSAKLTFGDSFNIIQDKRLREVNYGDLTRTDSKKVYSQMLEHINKPFPNGESYRDVERRIAEFLNYLLENYYGKSVAIVAHRAPQLALDVLLKGKTWEQAIKEDWRLTKKWQPGWEYEIRQKIEIPEVKGVKAPEAKIEEKAEAKIEEAKEIVETAKEIEKIPEAKIEEKPKKGFFERILKRKPKKVEAKEELKIEKPKEEKGIIDKIKKKITEKKIEEDEIKDILKDMEMSLISSDVAVEVSDKIISDLRKNLVGNFIKRGEIENVVKKSLRDSILDILKVEGFDLIERVKTKKPFLIVFLGFNGSGKTTSLSKLAKHFKDNGLRPILAAGDTWRKAAIEQLEEHGKKLGIEVVKHKYGADPAAVIFDSVLAAKARNYDVILADTAGRSHANTSLMDELKKICKVNKPDLKILVVDSLTGNDVVDQTKSFNDVVGVDGLILTKTDVYEKGGAILSAVFTIKKPILFLGTGQEHEDLEKFDPNKIVERLFE
jgi:fused signal recognition particle receptor